MTHSYFKYYFFILLVDFYIIPNKDNSKLKINAYYFVINCKKQINEHILLIMMWNKIELIS